MDQYDLELFHDPDEDNLRAQFFRNVATQFRGHIDELMLFRHRNTFRMRHLKKELDDISSQLMKECARTRVLEKDNKELKEQQKKERARNRILWVLVAVVVVVVALLINCRLVFLL